MHPWTRRHDDRAGNGSTRPGRAHRAPQAGHRSGRTAFHARGAPTNASCTHCGRSLRAVDARQEPTPGRGRGAMRWPVAHGAPWVETNRWHRRRRQRSGRNGRLPRRPRAAPWVTAHPEPPPAVQDQARGDSWRRWTAGSFGRSRQRRKQRMKQRRQHLGPRPRPPGQGSRALEVRRSARRAPTHAHRAAAAHGEANPRPGAAHGVARDPRVGRCARAALSEMEDGGSRSAPVVRSLLGYAPQRPQATGVTRTPPTKPRNDTARR